MSNADATTEDLSPDWLNGRRKVEREPPDSARVEKDCLVHARDVLIAGRMERGRHLSRERQGSRRAGAALQIEQRVSQQFHTVRPNEERRRYTPRLHGMVQRGTTLEASTPQGVRPWNNSIGLARRSARRSRTPLWFDGGMGRRAIAQGGTADRADRHSRRDGAGRQGESRGGESGSVRRGEVADGRHNALRSRLRHSQSYLREGTAQGYSPSAFSRLARASLTVIFRPGMLSVGKPARFHASGPPRSGRTFVHP